MDDLLHTIYTTPIIDNHAHPLLKPSAQTKYDLMSITTEAGGDAMKQIPSTLAHLRAVSQLSSLLNCEATWEAVTAAIAKEKAKPDDVWMKRCLEGIETVLVDDGLDGKHDVFDYDWHDRLTRSPCKRIVRTEKVAEMILNGRLEKGQLPVEISDQFLQDFRAVIEDSIRDPEVVGFKSVICYRTGLNIPVKPSLEDFKKALVEELLALKAKGIKGFKRLDCLPLNTFLIHETASLIRDTPAPFRKPLQFHTGLGDNDITLNTSSPSHLQPFIKTYPSVPIILLHASYPWTQEAGYLAAVYENVYADIGEVFPMISKEGQERVVREILEFCPSEKVLWSTDGHWFPETYLLAVVQVREALQAVLTDYVRSKALTVPQAIKVVEDILFNTSNTIYDLKIPLEPFPPSTLHYSALTLEDSDLARLTVFLAENPSTKFLRIQYLDYTATPRLRVIPLKRVLSLLEGGKSVSIGITKASLGLLQNDHIIPSITASGEYKLHAIFRSLRPGPMPGYASVQGEFREADGSEVALCPRTLLRHTLEKSKENGLEFLLGFEIEIVFLTPSDAPIGMAYETQYSALPNSSGHAWSTFLAFHNPKILNMISEIINKLSDSGIDIEQYHPESATGQYEFILPPLPPLEAVDTLIHAREIITSIAAKNNLRATLIPKPFPGMAGTASHAHLSITSPNGQNASTYNSFYAGILKNLRSIAAFTYSSVTSYERLVDGCWAGGRWVAWGTQNRETPLRKIEGSHWEFKCLDGLANMYFAMAAVFAAGTKGVIDGEVMRWKDCQADPASMGVEGRAELGIDSMFPASLDEALEALGEDEVMVGLVGRELVKRYVEVKRAEAELLNGMSKEAMRMWVIERY